MKIETTHIPRDFDATLDLVMLRGETEKDIKPPKGIPVYCSRRVTIPRWMAAEVSSFVGRKPAPLLYPSRVLGTKAHAWRLVMKSGVNLLLARADVAALRRLRRADLEVGTNPFTDADVVHRYRKYDYRYGELLSRLDRVTEHVSFFGPVWEQVPALGDALCMKSSDLVAVAAALALASGSTPSVGGLVHEWVLDAASSEVEAFGQWVQQRSIPSSYSNITPGFP